MKLFELGEDAFLRELETRIGSDPERVPIGIGDDAAALAVPPGENILVTTDALVESVHFTRRTLPPKYLGRKLVAVNASDIAAMGGVPLGVLLSLAVPEDTDAAGLWQVIEGASERAGELGMSLVGGNLSRSPGPIVADATVVGATIGQRALRRKGARPGDAIYVSGKIGASVTGLELLEKGAALSPAGDLIVPETLRGGPVSLAEVCIRAHIDPEPRIALGRALNEGETATSAIDLSDGLAMDLARLCRASGVGARVDEASLPLAPGLLGWERSFGRDPLARGLSGGEDYELLFTVGDEKRIEALRETSDVPLTRIGVVREDPGVVEIFGRDGSISSLRPSGWDHFRAG